MKAKEDLMSNNIGENHEKPGYTYRITPDDVATRVRISTGDLTIIKIYKHLLKKPITTILHEMIGTAGKCWEEKHDSVIKELREKVEELEPIVFAYYAKYGPLHVKRNVRNSIIKRKKESLDKPGS